MYAGNSSDSRVQQDDSCLAYRLHSTFIESNFDHRATLGEIATLQVVPYAAIAVALVISTWGHRILGPSVCILGFCAGSMASLHALYAYASALHNWDCNAIVGASFAMGGVMALVGATVVSAVAVTLGAMAGGALVVLMFDICLSCRTPLGEDAPVLLGRPLVPFWITFAVGVAVGAVVCRRRKAKILALVTSLIGGWGVAWGVRLAVGAQGETLPRWGGLTIAAGVTLVGFGVQLRLIRRAQRRAPRHLAVEAGRRTVTAPRGERAPDTPV